MAWPQSSIANLWFKQLNILQAFLFLTTFIHILFLPHHSLLVSTTHNIAFFTAHKVYFIENKVLWWHSQTCWQVLCSPSRSVLWLWIYSGHCLNRKIFVVKVHLFLSHVIYFANNELKQQLFFTQPPKIIFYMSMIKACILAGIILCIFR